MKLGRIVCAAVACGLLGLISRPAAAAAKGSDPEGTAISAADSAVTLAAPPAPEAPKDKPKKSKKNDPKDGDPGDGDAGGGNDGTPAPRTPPDPASN